MLLAASHGGGGDVVSPPLPPVAAASSGLPAVDGAPREPHGPAVPAEAPPPEEAEDPLDLDADLPPWNDPEGPVHTETYSSVRHPALVNSTGQETASASDGTQPWASHPAQAPASWKFGDPVSSE
jgi:hypothetical protein